MLGAASEQAILLLIESCAESISDTASKERFRIDVEKAPSIFRKYAIFDQRLPAARSHIPKELTDNLDSMLRGVFDLIRNSRNDAGHPATGAEVNRDAIYSHLRLFIPYCQRIYGLIFWFSSNKT
jgi:hypothetical protein